MATVIFVLNGSKSSRPLCTEKDLDYKPGKWELMSESQKEMAMMWYWANHSNYTYETVEED